MYWLRDKLIPINDQAEAAQVDDRQEKINKIVEELKKLEAREHNYTPNEDLCCICMNVMEEDDIVNLP